MSQFDEQEEGGGTGFNPAYAKYDTMTLSELGEAMVAVRLELDKAKDIKTALEKEYDFICTMKIPRAMEEAGLKNIRLAGGKGIRVQDEVFVSCPQANFDGFRTWLIEQGEDGIIKPTIHPSTLKSFIVNRVKDGKEYPAEFVNLTIVPKARFF